MEAAYSQGFVALEIWHDVATTTDPKTGKRTGRRWLRAELRDMARHALTAEGIPHGPPTVWRFEIDRDRLSISAIVGPDRVTAGDLIRNKRRYPRLSTGSPCAVCGLPGYRLIGPSRPVVAVSQVDDLTTDSIFDRTDEACPRHSRLVRTRLAYRFDPRVRG
jgi:hypothetical protein